MRAENISCPNQPWTMQWYKFQFILKGIFSTFIIYSGKQEWDGYLKKKYVSSCVAKLEMNPKLHIVKLNMSFITSHRFSRQNMAYLVKQLYNFFLCFSSYICITISLRAELFHYFDEIIYISRKESKKNKRRQFHYGIILP